MPNALVAGDNGACIAVVAGARAKHVPACNLCHRLENCSDGNHVKLTHNIGAIHPVTPMPQPAPTWLDTANLITIPASGKIGNLLNDRVTKWKYNAPVFSSTLKAPRFAK